MKKETRKSKVKDNLTLPAKDRKSLYELDVAKIVSSATSVGFRQIAGAGRCLVWTWIREIIKGNVVHIPLIGKLYLTRKQVSDKRKKAELSLVLEFRPSFVNRIENSTRLEGRRGRLKDKMEERIK
jgi:hypothetical protein